MLYSLGLGEARGRRRPTPQRIMADQAQKPIGLVDAINSAGVAG